VGPYDYDEEFDDRKRREQKPLGPFVEWMIVIVAVVGIGGLWALMTIQDGIDAFKRRRQR
jgi:hypothetical protein